MSADTIEFRPERTIKVTLRNIVYSPIVWMKMSPLEKMLADSRISPITFYIKGDISVEVLEQLERTRWEKDSDIREYSFEDVTGTAWRI